MEWKPYQDQENRAYSSILTTLFPEQAKTLPQILVWSVIFLIDLILVIGGSAYLGILQFDHYRNVNAIQLGGLCLFAAVVGIFWLQGVLWGWVCRQIQKRKDEKNVPL